MRNISSILSAACVITSVVGIGAASAADLPARTYTKAPAMVLPVFNWTGFYVGGNVGGGWGDVGASETGLPLGNIGAATSAPLGNRPSGVFGGVQAGYNWQTSNWVWGLEADFQGADIKGSSTLSGIGTIAAPAPIAGSFVNASEKIDYFGTVRARVGFLATPALLLYGTGGLAYADVKTTGQTFYPTPISYVSSGSTVKAGWTAGAGAEYKLTPNWSVKGEYLYYDVGHVTNVTNFGTPPNAPFQSQFNYNVRGNLVRVGVNYEFGGWNVAR